MTDEEIGKEEEVTEEDGRYMLEHTPMLQPDKPKPETVRITLAQGPVPWCDIGVVIPDERAWVDWLRGVKLDGFILTPGMFIPYAWITCINRLAPQIEGGNIVPIGRA